MNPKVTVIIPCYNSEKYVRESVSSALWQTHENVEIIAVDNESTDSTLEILKQMESENENLMVATAKNVYPNCWDEARLVGYKMMTGDYVTVIGSEDLREKDYIKNCVEIMTKAKGVIKAFQSPSMGFKDHKLGKVRTGIIDYRYNTREHFMKLSLDRCIVNSPSVFYDASLYEMGLLETFPEKYGGAADYDLYCKLADKGVMIYPAPNWLGFFYRWHPGQATWKVQEEETNYDKMIQDYWREKWET